VMAELPFMATEDVLMEACRQGGDRQALHERIRLHSLAAAAEVKAEGRPNDLIARLQQDPSFSKVNVSQVLDPRRYVGRAPQQVLEFTDKVVDPIRRRYASELGATVELKV
jgi:adenylosuccinate lyase